MRLFCKDLKPETCDAIIADLQAQLEFMDEHCKELSQTCDELRAAIRKMETQLARSLNTK